jgi:hypothetical protein
MVKACASATPLATGAALGGSPLSGVDDNDPRSNEQPEIVIASAITRATGSHGLRRQAPAKGSGMAIDADTRAAYGAIGILPGRKMHGSKTTMQKTTTEKITTENAKTTM